MATSTKKQLEEDFTKNPQATSAEDVNNQDARTRLWQSLSYTYGKQADESNKAYDKAVSEADRAALARGMGRSSYNLQTQANLLNQKVKAQNDVNSALIADYQNRIGEIEQQEKEEERWNKQFDYQKERDTVADQQWEKQFGYQKERDTVADQQWQKQYEEQLRQFNENMAYQRERANVSDAQWEKTYSENLRQFNEQMAQQEAQFKANLEFQQSEAARQQANWEIQQAFTEKQWEAQQAQWREEFDYSKMSDRQKLIFSYIETSLQQGNAVSDELLAEAGLTRNDYNRMAEAAAAKSGYGGSYSGPKKKDDTGTDSGAPTTTTPLSTKDDMIAAIDAFTGAGKNTNTTAGSVFRKDLSTLVQTTDSGKKATAKVVNDIANMEAGKANTLILKNGTKRFVNQIGGN